MRENVCMKIISDLENGKKTIELGKALQLANILGMDMILQIKTSPTTMPMKVMLRRLQNI